MKLFQNFILLFWNPFFFFISKAISRKFQHKCERASSTWHWRKVRGRRGPLSKSPHQNCCRKFVTPTGIDVMSILKGWPDKRDDWHPKAPGGSWSSWTPWRSSPPKARKWSPHSKAGDGTLIWGFPSPKIVAHFLGDFFIKDFFWIMCWRFFSTFTTQKKSSFFGYFCPGKKIENQIQIF